MGVLQKCIQMTGKHVKLYKHDHPKLHPTTTVCLPSISLVLQAHFLPIMNTMRALRLPAFQRLSRARALRSPLRDFSSTSRAAQTTHSSSKPERPVNFYKTYGRAFAKVITLAFLSYQISYWYWLLLETEEIKDEKNREIRSLEQEARLLDEGRKSHRPVAG